MMWSQILYVISILPFALLKEVVHDFDITYGYIAPDNYEQRAILINGKFPGPTIRVKQNDILVVNVKNYLDHGFAMHWHGMHQFGSQDSDGTPNITQDLIDADGGTYQYRININRQHGTFFYHPHTKYDSTWAYGFVIVDDSDYIAQDPRYFYDSERLISISQCWHIPSDDIYNGITGNPFVDVPDTDSILINGRSYGVWDNDSTTDGHYDKCNGYSVIRVKPNKIYRFRVLGFGEDSMVTFEIPEHTLTIIEVDGILIDPVETDHLELNVGQRYSVLVHTDQKIDNYLMTSKMIPGPGPDNGLAILHYKGASSTASLRKLIRPGETDEQDELTEWMIPEIHHSTSIQQSQIYQFPREYDREIVIRSTQEVIGGYTKFTVNDIVFQAPKENFLKQLRRRVDITNYPGVYPIRVGEAVQIVFQNRFSSLGVCEQHPWHMHGHTFYVVGSGPDEYDRDTAEVIFNENVTKNSIQFRDVVTLYPNRSDNETMVGTPCGWVAIRFIANNPGVWLVHCHLVAHMIMGKEFVLYEH